MAPSQTLSAALPLPAFPWAWAGEGIADQAGGRLEARGLAEKDLSFPRGDAESGVSSLAICRGLSVAGSVFSGR